MKPGLLAFVLCGALLAACGAEEDGPVCCTPSVSPSCDCFTVGGTVDSAGACHGLCDQAGPYELRVDENGCEYWFAAGTAAECMFDSDVVVVDAADDAADDTSDETDFGDNIDDADSGTPTDVVGDVPDPEICCPIDAWNCGCVYYGGTRPVGGTCQAICDADPPSASGTDENGCPFMVPGSGSCIDPGPDAGSCTPSTFACSGACGFNFSSFAADRDGLVTVGIAVGAAGPVQITSIAIVGSSPKASFSTSFVDYIDRISGGTWVANETDTAFDVRGDLAAMPAGSTFEIDVRFRAVADGTGCPSADDCGAVVVQWESCGVAGAELRLPIRR